MNDEKLFTIEETKLMNLYIRALRYAFTRDNHLEPYVTINELREYLPNLHSENKVYWYQKFLDETESEIRWRFDKPFEPQNEKLIEEFINFLKEFLESRTQVFTTEVDS